MKTKVRCVKAGETDNCDLCSHCETHEYSDLCDTLPCSALGQYVECKAIRETKRPQPTYNSYAPDYENYEYRHNKNTSVILFRHDQLWRYEIHMKLCSGDCHMATSKSYASKRSAYRAALNWLMDQSNLFMTLYAHVARKEFITPKTKVK